ncbi:hypothetical protein GCM10011351_28430 [Paraliobacillus quinghaiensis]|uniref:Competence protein n=1 Tax=Paraliobacillus quinghaiensis TaxID=470815 RepID=A0A917TVV1_9BACI|nr:competence protein ComK [Paraliobacillus quinghaiensis]GGM40547.1 hypothetical protein GCM10011351_28430 [Paraliobacillus quinghaiensis]
MSEVVIDYYVTNRTIALLPVKHFEYDTVVIEVGCKKYVKQTALQIIKQACLDGASSYQGRRSAVSYKTGIKRKVPIPINLVKNIYAFPTQSPSQYDCSWIFYNHILCVTPNVPTSETDYKSIITFKNNQNF